MRSAVWQPGVLALVVAAGLGAGACARARASVAPESPPLAVPDAPPRVISPIEVVEVLPPAPAEPEPATPGPANRPRAPRDVPPKPEPARAEPEPRTPARAPARLSTPLSASDAEVERQIRDRIVRTVRVLDGVNEGALAPEAKVQYETARRFVKQAEEGLEAKNYVFAGLVADKAETLAASLVRR